MNTALDAQPPVPDDEFKTPTQPPAAEADVHADGPGIKTSGKVVDLTSGLPIHASILILLI